MRVMHLVNHVRNVGNGITNVCVDLALEQARSGHEVVVASAGGDFEQLLNDMGVTIVRIDFANRGLGGLVQSTRRLRRAVTTFSPEIVHSHTITPAVLAAVASRGVTVATVHNEYQSGVRLMGLASRVVGVSAAVTSQMRRRGVADVKLATIVNGPIGSLRRTAPRSATHYSQPTFVAVGAISHRKGSDVLIRATARLIAQVPQARLVFVGADHYPGLAADVRAQGLDENIDFVGFTPSPEQYVIGATALVLASRREPLGLVALEAQALGVPVIGSEVDGIPEATNFGAAGLLVPVEDDAALCEAMLQLATDVELRERLRQGALRHAEQRTTRLMHEAYMSVYEDAIARRS